MGTTGGLGALIEPDDGVEVQVVSGLIQHQQRGLHEQRPAEWSVRLAKEDGCLCANPGPLGGRVL